MEIGLHIPNMCFLLHFFPMAYTRFTTGPVLQLFSTRHLLHWWASSSSSSSFVQRRLSIFAPLLPSRFLLRRHPLSVLPLLPPFSLRAIPYLSSSYLRIRRRFKHRRKRQSFFINQVGECPTGRFLFSLLFSSRSLSSSKVGFCLLLFLLSRAISHRTILLLHENGSCFCFCFFFPCDLRPKSSPPPFCPSASASIPRISKRKERLDPLYTPAAELQRKNESGAA